MRHMRGWETVAAVASACAAGWLCKPDVYHEATGELVTLLGIVMAAFIPTMLLAATSLRAGRFSTTRLLALSAALDRQVALFGGLFLYALGACLLIIWGKVSAWHVSEILVRGWRIDLSGCFQIAITGLLSFLALRTFALVAGVRSILRLTSTMALDEAAEREAAQARTEAAELQDYATPPQFGEPLNTPLTPVL